MNHEIASSARITPVSERRSFSTVLSRYRALFVFIAAAIVFLLSFNANLNDVHNTQFHPDESRWINRAHYLSDWQNPLGIEWGDRYLLRGQPPFASYVTALGLLVQGQNTSTNDPFNFNYGNERLVTWQAGHAAMPSYDDIIAARQTSAFIGALTAALLVVVLSKLTNLIGGVVGGFFLSINGLQEYLSSTALSDATLSLIIVLCTLTVIRLARKPAWSWTLLLGILLGCGMAAKLSPIALSIGFAMIGGLFLIRPWLVKIPYVGTLVNYLIKGRESAADRLAWMLLSLPIITVSTFVFLYPYVWSAPYSRTMGLFDFRTTEMRAQARIWPGLRIDGRIDALGVLWRVFQRSYSSTGDVFRILSDRGILPDGIPGGDVVLAGIGFSIAVAMILRRGVVTPLAFGFFLVSGQAAAVIVGLRVDFNRYYLPILLFGALCVGYLAGEIMGYIDRNFVRRPKDASELQPEQSHLPSIQTR